MLISGWSRWPQIVAGLVFVFAAFDLTEPGVDQLPSEAGRVQRVDQLHPAAFHAACASMRG